MGSSEARHTGGNTGTLSKATKSIGGDGPVGKALQAFRGVSRRLLHGIVQGVGSTCTISGIAKVAGLYALVATGLLGAKRAAQVWVASLGVVMTVTSALAARHEPQGDMGASFLQGISGGDSGSLTVGVVSLMDVFDRVLETFPELARPRLSAMRDAAPAELLLRFMTCVSTHMRMAPHPKSNEKAPRDFMGPQPGGEVQPDPQDENRKAPGDPDDQAGAEHMDTGAAKNTDMLAGFRGMIDVQSAQVGEAAGEEDLEELRHWLPWVEATYYEFEKWENIQAWLKAHGAQTIYIQLQATPNSAAHLVAYHKENKQLLILVRGTMEASDAITNMVVTPEVWGDNDHTVHSGIGTCVDKIYARTAAIAAAFHKDGYDIRLIGHSLGAACAGLLAWRFQQDGLERTRAIVYACPPCASPTLAQETQDYVLTVVMRYDAVPRLSPKTVVAMEEELLNISWEQMDATADEWGGFGRMLYRRAKHMHEKTKQEQQKLEEKYRKQIPSKDEKQDDDEDGPQAMLDPTVLGKIIWLRPANKFAIMFGAHDKDLQREGVKDTCKKENAKKEKMDDKQWYQQSSDAQKFDPRVIPADAPALCTVRMAQQSFNDHYLGAYRCGLGMEVRMNMGTEGYEDKEDNSFGKGDSKTADK